MPKGKASSYEENVVAETGKWNTSKAYTEVMIMKLLYECNTFQKICFHGTTELIEDFIVNEDEKTNAKLFAIERFVTTLRMLCSNIKFQVNSNYREAITTYQSTLKLFHAFIPSTKIIRTSQSQSGSAQWVEINDKVFNHILEETIKINEELSNILTLSDLIYYTITEFDEDSAKDDFMKKFVDEG